MQLKDKEKPKIYKTFSTKTFEGNLFTASKDKSTISEDKFDT